ncbi:hypothetical protein RQM65_10475 [Pricia sp. S334]|uniref:Uncharacterized protein n=1 Tax=Pricia mediterranea TaxID=3076079 RepID=A0ABU3L7D6_9FLAO|nr:hypothetical protein [Pricia sp. S334]MDT7829089.1 hypothetical protein [Pricia sp. S334]
MKKCVLMFTLWVMVLVLAVLSQAKNTAKFDQGLIVREDAAENSLLEKEVVIGENMTENAVLGKNLQDSIR